MSAATLMRRLACAARRVGSSYAVLRSARVEPLEVRSLLSVVPVGGEFPINVQTLNEQIGGRVATAHDGSFVVVWYSLGQEGAGLGSGVYARRYDVNGAPVTGEIHVNTYSTSDQARPAVAMDADGNFVVVWQSNGQDGAFNGIYAQRFDTAGQHVGNEFRVNTYTGGDEAFPSIAMDADGDFVVTWDTAAPGGSLYDVYAQRYNAAGQPLGGEFRVNSLSAGHQYSSSVAMDDDGNFVVSWIDSTHDGSGYGIYARRFNAAGVPQGDDFPVNSYTTSDQLFPSVAMDADGDFVIVWQSSGQDGSLTGIFGQRFDATGTLQGSEFLVNSVTQFSQEGPAVDMDAEGNFFVVWESFGQDASLSGVLGRAFRNDGTAAGNEFLINTHVIGDQEFPAISVNPQGQTVVVWQSRHDGSERGIFGQRYLMDLIPPSVQAEAFRYQTAPHLLRLSFNEDVSASLSSADLMVQTVPGGAAVAVQLDSYDTATNTATFSFPAPANGLLDDGNYRATLLASGISDSVGNAMAADHVFDFFFLRGDANHDGSVNLSDFNILAANFGQSPRDFTQGDFNYDGTVNLSDFNILAGRFGTVLAPSMSSALSPFSKDPVRGAGRQESSEDPVTRLLK